MRLAIGTLAILGTILFLTGCGGAGSAEKPHATVVLRDGSKVAGFVESSSPSEIRITGDDQQSRTFAMKDVRRIEYSDPAAAEPEAQHAERAHPAQSVITSKTSRLAAGTDISVRNEETIDSAKAREGQVYAAEVTRDVKDAGGDVVIPRGSNAQIVIRSASKGGRIRGASDLVLDLQAVSVDGQQYQLSTADLEQKGADGVGANKRTATFTGGGAAVGAIIGAIAGGGQGAAIGAASGAGAGAAAQVLTKGSIKVPVETVLTFALDKPLRVTAAK